jgi:Right handed beta helix region
VHHHFASHRTGAYGICLLLSISWLACNSHAKRIQGASLTRIALGIGAALALAVTLPAVSAQAQNGALTRAFVSSTGADSNACTITAPCASFAVAYTKVGANGIIAALDPGKYGPLTISGPVTVNGNGWAAITGSATSSNDYSGILINAGSGNVVLTGLEIDGANASTNGIIFNTGSSLTINNCIVQNFTGAGILMQPTSATVSVAITNTTVSSNENGGLRYYPQGGSTTADIVIDHVVVTNNQNDPGIDVNTTGGGGAATVAILNSTVSGNNLYGIYLSNGAHALSVTIDNTDVVMNNTGLIAYGTTTVLLNRSAITSNMGAGIVNGTSPNSFYTYLNNAINGNGSAPSSDVAGTAMITDAPK